MMLGLPKDAPPTVGPPSGDDPLRLVPETQSLQGFKASAGGGDIEAEARTAALEVLAAPAADPDVSTVAEPPDTPPTQLLDLQDTAPELLPAEVSDGLVSSPQGEVVEVDSAPAIEPEADPLQGIKATEGSDDNEVEARSAALDATGTEAPATETGASQLTEEQSDAPPAPSAMDEPSVPPPAQFVEDAAPAKPPSSPADFLKGLLGVPAQEVSETPQVAPALEPESGPVQGFKATEGGDDIEVEARSAALDATGTEAPATEALASQLTQEPSDAPPAPSAMDEPSGPPPAQFVEDAAPAEPPSSPADFLKGLLGIPAQEVVETPQDVPALEPEPGPVQGFKATEGGDDIEVEARSAALDATGTEAPATEALASQLTQEPSDAPHAPSAMDVPSLPPPAQFVEDAAPAEPPSSPAEFLRGLLGIPAQEVVETPQDVPALEPEPGPVQGFKATEGGDDTEVEARSAALDATGTEAPTIEAGASQLTEEPSDAPPAPSAMDVPSLPPPAQFVEDAAPAEPPSSPAEFLRGLLGIPAQEVVETPQDVPALEPEPGPVQGFKATEGGDDIEVEARSAALDATGTEAPTTEAGASQLTEEPSDAPPAPSAMDVPSLPPPAQFVEDAAPAEPPSSPADFLKGLLGIPAQEVVETPLDAPALEPEPGPVQGFKATGGGDDIEVEARSAALDATGIEAPATETGGSQLTEEPVDASPAPSAMEQSSVTPPAQFVQDAAPAQPLKQDVVETPDNVPALEPEPGPVQGFNATVGGDDIEVEARSAALDATNTEVPATETVASQLTEEPSDASPAPSAMEQPSVTPPAQFVQEATPAVTSSSPIELLKGLLGVQEDEAVHTPQDVSALEPEAGALQGMTSTEGGDDIEVEARTAALQGMDAESPRTEASDPTGPAVVEEPAHEPAPPAAAGQLSQAPSVQYVREAAPAEPLRSPIDLLKGVLGIPTESASQQPQDAAAHEPEAEPLPGFKAGDGGDDIEVEARSAALEAAEPERSTPEPAGPAKPALMEETSDASPGALAMGPPSESPTPEPVASAVHRTMEQATDKPPAASATARPSDIGPAKLVQEDAPATQDAALEPEAEPLPGFKATKGSDDIEVEARSAALDAAGEEVPSPEPMASAAPDMLAEPTRIMARSCCYG